MLKKRGGFALPTVLIASVVMLAVLVSSISAVAATRTALQSQFFAQLARTAAESGLAMAESCIKSGTTTWSSPLRPGGTCAGLAAPCSTSDCYLVSNEGYRTSFSVTAPTIAGDASTVQATGILEQVRTTTGGVVRTYTQPLRQKDVTNGVQSLSYSQIEIGTSHACAVSSGNKAYCWGDNSSGRLGDGTTIDRSTPVAVSQGALPAGATIRQLAAGAGNTCVIASDNKVYCWGGNGYGQLGDGTTTARSTPVAVSQGALPAGATIRQVAAGSSHTCVIASDNKVYCWGYNSYGQLGDGTTTNRSTPVAVSQGALPAGATIRQVAVGGSNTCVIASDNKVYCWGDNYYGQLANGTTTNRSTPVAVSQGALPAGATIRQLAVGNGYICANASNNKAYCWGYNTSGQLGDSTATNRSMPVAVSQGALPAGATIRQVAAGFSHTCAIASDNDLYCWGYNGSGQLGDSTTVNRYVPVLVSRVIDSGTTPFANGQILAGADYTCAIASDNKAYCWGYNLYGQLGDGTTTNRTSPASISQGALPSGATIRQVSTDIYHTCAIASDNKAYCWGYNPNGQLGDGTTTSRTAPVAVSQGALPFGAIVNQIAVGYLNTCAIASDNKAYCWGYNLYGQLGDSTTTNRSTPVAVSQGALPSGAIVRQIATGLHHACAIASDNKTYCWGRNNYGQLGDGTTTDRTAPVAVSQGALPSGATVRQIAVGDYTTCAIASDNKTYCWGRNANGQLGDGTTTDRTAPVAVSQGSMPAGATVNQISVGSATTCAIASDNKAYCWGYNYYGQLGDGTTTDRTTPVTVSQGSMPAGATVNQISVGSSSICAIASDIKTYCWGQNNYGKLGDGTTTTRTSPVALLSLPLFPPLTTTTYYF